MKYRLPILICVLLLTAGGIFLFQTQIELATPSVPKANCDWVKLCLRAERAWPPGMESCPRILVPGTVRSRNKDGKWGYSMSIGECNQSSVIVEHRYEVAEKFGNNGLAKVRRDGKWGYVNLKGEEIIPPHYDEVGDFDFGLVPVRSVNNTWSYYDARGQKLEIPTSFAAVSGIWRNELSAVQPQFQGKWGYVNPRGEMVIKADFDKATEFQKGLAKVEANRKWGVINTAGEIVIPLAFDAIFSPPDARLLLVTRDGRYGYYDSDGKEIIPPILVKPVQARYNSGGIQVILNAAALTSIDKAPATSTPDVLTNTWYFLDAPNEKLRFDENGKAQFWRNGEWFYISQTGALLK